MATNLQDKGAMKTKWGCIVVPCGCLMPLMTLVLLLLVTGTVVLANCLF